MQIPKQPHKLTPKAIKHKKTQRIFPFLHVKVFSFFTCNCVFSCYIIIIILFFNPKIHINLGIFPEKNRSKTVSQTVLVFVKQVPDTQNITGDAMTPAGTVNRAALPAIFNPEDLNALELALQLKDRYGVKVVVGTMGPPAAAEVLRSSLFRGADECILLTDRAFAGADTLATSYALSCCAKKVGKVDKTNKLGLYNGLYLIFELRLISKISFCKLYLVAN